MRTTRAATGRYGADEDFPVGGSRKLRDGGDQIVAAGIAAESLKAAEQLAGEGIEPAHRPLFGQARSTPDAARRGRGHRWADPDRRGPLARGGIGDAVLEALSDGETPARVVRLAGDAGSGKPAEPLARPGHAEHIATAARSLVGRLGSREERR